MKMASVQERLNAKRLPLDNWTISEKLCLASAVTACSSDQNWMSVSRTLKQLCGNNRPDDWFSQKSCAAQYGKLLENVETPKRKKRNEKDTIQTTIETPGELILRKLTQERIAELDKCIQDEREEYGKIQKEIAEIESGAADEQKLRQWCAEIDAEEKRHEREKQKQAQWLKEREERRRQLERPFRNTSHYHQVSPSQSPSKLPLKGKIEEMDVDDANSRQGTSPLLTSLLKSPSPAPNPTMLHNVQARVTAPTITNLLTGSTTTQSVDRSAFDQTSYSATPIQALPLTGPVPTDQSINNVSQSPSLSAPTLSMLLENKSKESFAKVPSLGRIDPTPTEGNEGKPVTLGEQVVSSVDALIKDEDQQLMEDFNGLIPDNIDELANILNENNEMIPELLEEESILDNVDELIGVTDNAPDAVELNSTLNQPHPVDESKDVEMTEIIDEKPQETLKIEPTKSEEDDIDESKEKQSESIVLVTTETKTEEFPTEVKKSERLSPSKLIKLEKVVMQTRDDDDDSSSDASNDTPLSELIKQDSIAKAEAAAAAAEAVTKAEADAKAEAIAKMEEEAEIKVKPIFVPSTIPVYSRAESVVKPEKEKEPYTFESDSNDDKCLGSFKREIESAQKADEEDEAPTAAPIEISDVADEDEKVDEKAEPNDVVIEDPVIEVQEDKSEEP